MKSLYERYIKERENLDVVATDRGFVIYKTKFPHAVINDIYVVPEARLSGHASFLANQVFEICKQAGIASVLCQTDSEAIGWEDSQKAILAFGFHFIGEDRNLKFYELEVSEWERL